MAFAFVAARGTNTAKAAGTTLAVSPTANLAVGALVVVSCASNNNGTTDADDTTEHSLADSKGNTWTKGKERRYSAGAAADGIVTSIWWTVVTTQILTTDSITLTTPSVVARVISVAEFSTGGLGVAQVGSVSGTVAANGTGPAITVGSLTSGREYLWLATDGYEGPNGDAFTQDGNYNGHGAIGTTGGSADTNVDVRPARRISSSITTSTHTGTDTTAARDWASVQIALVEPNANATPAAAAAVAAVAGGGSGGAIISPTAAAGVSSVDGNGSGGAITSPTAAAAVAAIAGGGSGGAILSPTAAAAVAAVSGAGTGDAEADPGTAAAVAAVRGGAIGGAIVSGGINRAAIVLGAGSGGAIHVLDGAAAVAAVSGIGAVDVEAGGGIDLEVDLPALVFTHEQGFAFPSTLAIVARILAPFVRGRRGAGTDVVAVVGSREASGRGAGRVEARGGIRGSDAT